MLALLLALRLKPDAFELCGEVALLCGSECVLKFRAPINRSPGSTLSHPFFSWEGSPTKIDLQKKQVGTLILRSSPLEDLVVVAPGWYPSQTRQTRALKKV